MHLKQYGTFKTRGCHGYSKRAAGGIERKINTSTCKERIDGKNRGAEPMMPQQSKLLHRVQTETIAYTNTALGSDGQGPKAFSFIFLDLFDFFDLFADLARACLGLVERPLGSCEVVRVRMDRTIAC